MHREQDNEHFHPYDMTHGHLGHNNPRPAAQWQTPHAPHDHEHGAKPDEAEPDFDLVEKAFTDNFPNAPDPTSFLRLAGIPFEATAADGRRLQLLRVTQDNRVDIGSLTPHLGGETFRYDPLPSAMVSRRQSLGFVYFDGEGIRHLSFAEARALSGAASEPT
ncbi:hypothetical protein [Jiella marina]|uniref:hypothetical protein n=1 Tax=Jiella sp. LLJ827 TaxID=2917712 RepID=UPI002100FFB9|nr:hypothetical protein [Jiella sp. LLJ827]MCQ0987471.1 hypothetical protein [Jiella sp. LLJ827]